MTIGDVLAVIAAAIVSSIGWAACVLAAALLAPHAVEAAGQALRHSAGRSAARGLGLLIAVVAATAWIATQAPGPARLLALVPGGVGLTYIWIGCAAVSTAAGNQAARLDPSISGYHALLRGTTCVCAACWVPVAGQLVLFPALLAVALGSAVPRLAWRHPSRALVERPL